MIKLEYPDFAIPELMDVDVEHQELLMWWKWDTARYNVLHHGNTHYHQRCGQANKINPGFDHVSIYSHQLINDLGLRHMLSDTTGV